MNIYLLSISYTLGKNTKNTKTKAWFLSLSLESSGETNTDRSLQRHWSVHDSSVHGVLWGLKEGHLTWPGRSREGFLEKEVYPKGRVGIRWQRKGMVDKVRGELKLTSGTGGMKWNDTYGEL